MRATVAESLLLASLLLLASYVAWDAGPALGLQQPSWLATSLPWLMAVEVLLAVLLLVAAYWALQALGYNQLSFWLMVGITILPHSVTAWGHNQIEWYELFGLQLELVGERFLFWDAVLFHAALAGLIALYRLIGLRNLERRMVLQGIRESDRRQVLQYETLLLAGLLAVGLLLALFTILVAALLGQYDEFMADSPWAAGSIGVAVALLLALTLLIWRRGQ